MNFKTKIFLPVLLAGSAVFGAAETKPMSDIELFNATVKNVDMGGKELQYNNLLGLKGMIDQFIAVITSALKSSPDFADNPQAQIGLMAFSQILDIAGIDSVQAYAQSVSAVGNGNGRVRSFVYTGAAPRGLYFDLVSRENRPFVMVKNIPSSADGMIAMGCFLNFNSAWEGLKKNVVPGSQAGALPIMLEMQYEQSTGQKLSALLDSISGEYQVIARVYMNGGIAGISADMYLSIPDRDGVLTGLLKKNTGSTLQADKNGAILLPRSPDMPDFVVPRMEFVPGRIIIASGNRIAGDCKSGAGKFNPASLVKLMPDGKGTGYLLIDVPRKTLDTIAANVPQMASLIKNDGGLKINAAGFAAPDGYGCVAEMNFVPDSLSVAGAMVGIQMNMLLPALEKSRGKARMISCSGNLKQIGFALQMYNIDYNGKFPEADGPAGLEVLRSGGYISDSKIFCCPGDDTPPAGRGEKLDFDNCDYFYFGGLKNIKNPQSMPQVIEMNDHNGAVNVLFADGHVECLRLPGDDCDVDDVVKYLFSKKMIDVQQRDLLLKKIAKFEDED